jgi:hypothetical protein
MGNCCPPHAENIENTGVRYLPFYSVPICVGKEKSDAKEHSLSNLHVVKHSNGTVTCIDSRQLYSCVSEAYSVHDLFNLYSELSTTSDEPFIIRIIGNTFDRSDQAV